MPKRGEGFTVADGWQYAEEWLGTINTDAWWVAMVYRKYLIKGDKSNSW